MKQKNKKVRQNIPTPESLPFRVSVLVFLKNTRGEYLLLKRNKAPNKNCWSPVGGKLHTHEGESPFECAVREVWEEANLTITNEDLHLFAMISEKGYEGSGHWLLFLFDCHKTLNALPPEISEGRFAFYSREAIEALALPDTDRQALWAIYDKHRQGFVALKADCFPHKKLEIILEESH